MIYITFQLFEMGLSKRLTELRINPKIPKKLIKTHNKLRYEINEIKRQLVLLIRNSE